MPLSCTYRYLDTFIKKDNLEKNLCTKKISLGLAVLKLGTLAGEKISLIGLTQPFMVKLAELSQETVVLTIVQGLEAMCVNTIESSRLVRLSMKPGATIPLHSGSRTKILLVYQNDSFVEEVINVVGLKKLNANTITDSKALKNELQLIREQGFAQSESEVDADATDASRQGVKTSNTFRASEVAGAPLEPREADFNEGSLSAKNFQTGVLPEWLETRGHKVAQKYFVKKTGGQMNLIGIEQWEI